MSTAYTRISVELTLGLEYSCQSKVPQTPTVYGRCIDHSMCGDESDVWAVTRQPMYRCSYVCQQIHVSSSMYFTDISLSTCQLTLVDTRNNAALCQRSPPCYMPIMHYYIQANMSYAALCQLVAAEAPHYLPQYDS